MRYKGNGNIREYIMEMSHLASKLKTLKLELSEYLLVHFILISLPAHFGQFKVSYNTLKDTWSLSELISYCVQEEERLQQDKTESAHMASSSQYKRKRDTTANVPSQQKKAKKQDQVSTCFFCKKVGHVKKDCTKYATWRVKKGIILTFVCSEASLSYAPVDTWWVDSVTSTHVSVIMQGCLWSRPPSDAERYIYVADGNIVAVETIGTFRLCSTSGFNLDY